MCDFEMDVQTVAPLAEAELPAAGQQPLTLADLEQWHAGVVPETLGTENQESEGRFLDDLENALQAPEQDLSGAQPRAVKVLRVPTEEAAEDEVSRDPEQALKALKEALRFEQGNRRYALDKRDDLRRLAKQSELLLQRAPQYLERLSQVIHAHEQCQLLYDRLSDLSEKRGAATLIIQTARQIEVLEKNLKEKRFRREELKKIQQDLALHHELTLHYQQLFQQISQIELLSFD